MNKLYAVRQPVFCYNGHVVKGVFISNRMLPFLILKHFQRLWHTPLVYIGNSPIIIDGHKGLFVSLATGTIYFFKDDLK